MKALYRMLSDKYRIPRFRRNYDPAQWEAQDPVNLALSAANACMYGIVHAAVLALGARDHPARLLLNDSSQPERYARVRLGGEFRLLKILREIVTDIETLLGQLRDEAW